MSGLTLFAGAGGSIVLPAKDGLLNSRDDGGHLIVNPPRAVWERSELSADELTQWSFLIAALGRAMIDVLSQLEGGCVNYWDAGNWALNEQASPLGPKTAPRHRSVHQHVIGRSRSAANSAWIWGEAPRFPSYADRLTWNATFEPLSTDECAAIATRVQELLADKYGVAVSWDAPALVIFDMAGTTVEDGGQVPQAFVKALADQGIAVSAEQIAGVRGSSKREAIRRFIPEGPDRDTQTSAAYDAFRHHLSGMYTEGGAREIAGASEVFARLRRRGVRVALNTGFDRMITDLLLRALGWSNGVVDAVVCGDDVERGRPAPDLIRRAMKETGIVDPARVANVGDTTLDLEAGSAAGARWNIGVLSGAHDRERLSAAPHTHIVADLSQLTTLWPGL